MSPEALRLHPEVEGIVREIVARPAPQLLRVRGQPEARAFSSTRTEIGGHESWLASAERHLVQVHREEIAFALRLAAWHRMATGLDGFDRVHRTVTASTSVPLPTRSAIRASAGLALQGVLPTGVEPMIHEALERLVDPEGVSAVEPVLLLQAAHRLVPSERGRILAGSAFALRHQPGPALLCFGDAIRSRPAVEFEAVAWNNVADVLDGVNGPVSALRALERATRLLPGFVFAEAGRLWCSIRVGHIDVARGAAREIDAIEAIEPGALDEVERHWTRRREQGGATLSPDRVLMLRAVRDGAGAGARRLIDALT
ncbi:MAG: hypothetical protein JNK02_03065 [Planctomycetes bacterium]|nr:hypothetical protein [Planctomycetota bacterium]